MFEHLYNVRKKMGGFIFFAADDKISLCCILCPIVYTMSVQLEYCKKMVIFLPILLSETVLSDGFPFLLPKILKSYALVLCNLTL